MPEPSQPEAETCKDTFNPWSVVNLVFHHLADQGLHPTLGENVEITPLLAEDAWTALVDPNQLSTAILNLALNARDAMPNGGKLALETGNICLDENYAGLHDDPEQRRRATTYLKGFGGLVGFELRQGSEAGARFIDVSGAFRVGLAQRPGED